MILKNVGSFICLLLVPLFVISYPTFANSGNKSLKAIWENPKEVDSVRFRALAEYYIANNQAQPDSTLRVLDYYEKLAKEKNNKKELYNVANDRGGIYRFKGETDLAMRYYKEAERLAISLHDSALIATVLGNLGNVYANLNDYKSAIQHFHRAYTIFKRIENKKGESHMLMSMGTVYLNIKDFDVALEYYREAQAIFRQVEVPERRKAVVYLNLGWIKYEQKKWDEAIVEYERALNILAKTNEKFFMVECHSMLAKIYIEKKDSKKARLYAEANNQLSKDLNVFEFLVDSKIIFARLELLKGNVEGARKQGESILAELDSSTSKNLKLHLYDLLYKCYQAAKNPEKSLKMFQLYTNCKDSMQAEVNELSVVREALKIQFTDILEQKRLNAEKEKEMQASAFRRNLFYLLGTLVLIMAVAGFYLNKNLQAGRKKREDLLEELTRLKSKDSPNLVLPSTEFQLVRENIEKAIDRKLNDTDWNVLNILLKEPDISNKEIADKAFMSVDGIGSSLRRMYVYFDIRESKYKKISLITEAIKASGNSYPVT